MRDQCAGACARRSCGAHGRVGVGSRGRLVPRLSLARESANVGQTMTVSELETLVQEAIPTASVKAVDLNGGGDHFELLVVCEQFEGRSMVERHRIVYGALGDAMRGAVHALRIQALTPDQFKKGLIGDIGRS